jgi:hypothetical protein
MADNEARFALSMNTSDLRDALNSVELGLGRQVGQILKAYAAPIAAEAATLAPFDPNHDKNHAKDGLPHLRDTIRQGGSSALAATIVSSHPAASIFEWNDGVTPAIAPRGVPLTIKTVAMAHKAFEHQRDRMAADVQDKLDQLARKYLDEPV